MTKSLKQTCGLSVGVAWWAVGGSGRVACEQCTFLLPSSSSSSLALLPTSLRMGLCRGDGVWPGRLRVDIWKEGDRQSGPLGLRGESWGLSTTESAQRDEKEGLC